VNRAWFAALILALAQANAWACGFQRENSVFVDARAEYQRLGSAEQAPLAAEWKELETEQKALWKMAGELDAGCTTGELPDGITAYLPRLGAWEERLRRFLKSARSESAGKTGRQGQSFQAKPDSLDGTNPQEVAPPPSAPGAGAGNSGSSEIEFKKDASPRSSPPTQLPPRKAPEAASQPSPLPKVAPSHVPENAVAPLLL
jgi:hypothetical protein